MSGATVQTKGEPLYEPPLDVGPVSAVRGSVIVLDVACLRAHGRFEAYRKELGRHAELLEVMPTDWVPAPLFMEHWHAMDRLGLPVEDYRELGRYVGEKAHHQVLVTLMRLAGRIGVTPWLALAQCHKVWLRTWQGGGMAVYRLGEQTARIDVINSSCAEAKAFQNGICGTIEAGLAPFCKKPLIVERAEERTPMSLVLRATWQR